LYSKKATFDLILQREMTCFFEAEKMNKMVLKSWLCILLGLAVLSVAFCDILSSQSLVGNATSLRLSSETSDGQFGRYVCWKV
jgi:hypothetical protein